MVQDITQLGADPMRPGNRSRPTPMAMCPMATMCRGMMEKPPSGVLLMLPGFALVAAGVLTFVEPRILIWLVGTAAVLMGIMLLVIATFIQRLGRRWSELEPQNQIQKPYQSSAKVDASDVLAPRGSTARPA